MDLEQKITDIITPALDDQGLDLVDINLRKSGRWTLEITIERQDDVPVGIDDCTSASREISAILDVEDPIDCAYNLEVSSPGLDRPLKKEQDFVRFAGERVKIKTFKPIDDQRKFDGILMGIEGQDVVIHQSGVECKIELSNISKAKLDPELNFKKH